MLIVTDKIFIKRLYLNRYKLKLKFKIVVTFLTAYNGISNVTNKIIKLYSAKPLNGEDYNGISISPGACEFESLNDDCKGIMEKEGSFKEKFIQL